MIKNVQIASNKMLIIVNFKYKENAICSFSIN